MERILLVNQQEIKLSLVNQLGQCSKCQQNTELRLTGQSSNQTKKYCGICSLEFLTRLENYHFINKEQIIREIKDLLNSHSSKLWTDYYSCKKPTCFSCLQAGIKANEYAFCENDCLVQHWIKYHGKNYFLKNHG